MGNEELENKLWDIIDDKASIIVVSKEAKVSRQTLYAHMTKLEKSFEENEEYAYLIAKYTPKTNNIVKLDIEKLKKDFKKKYQREANEDILNRALRLFKYSNKKKIFAFDRHENLLWISDIEIKTLNKIISEGFKDLGRRDIVSILKSNNIKADLSFVQMYDDNVVKFSKSVDAHTWLYSFMSEQEEPFDKETLYMKAEVVGFPKKKIYNTFSTNYAEDYVNIGTKICLKEIFFSVYLANVDLEAIVNSAVDACIKHNILKTDAAWLKNTIEKEYPEVALNLNAHELKAILVDTDKFQKDVKLNLIYVDAEPDIEDVPIEKIVEEILKDQEMPLKLSLIYGEVNKRGRYYSLTTLASLVFPKMKSIKKLDYGWISAEKYEKAKALLEELSKFTKNDIVNAIKKEFNAESSRELAEVSGLKFSSLVKTEYSVHLYRPVILTDIYASGLKLEVKDGEIKVIR